MDDETVSKLVDDAVERMRGRGGLTVPEVLAILGELGIQTAGERDILVAENIVIWTGVTPDAITLMNKLWNHPLVERVPSDRLTYLHEGYVIDFPEASKYSLRPGYNYKTAHWLPIELVVAH